jgi:anti-sigma regulatory factor (Ser/Thr protein kinase)
MMRVLGGTAQLRMEIANVSQVGECRRAAQALARQHGFNDTGIGKTGIVATELANNLLRHAVAGELLIQVLDQGALVELELIALDHGPGMGDVQRCLRDGYSTAGTAGTGLGAVLRQSSTFDIHSVPGRGTVVLSRIAREPAAAATRARRAAAGAAAAPLPAVPLQVGAICVAMLGQSECGDAWSIARSEACTAMLVVDGLGHGPAAAAAARAAGAAFSRRPFDAPADAMRQLHLALAGTRGAAAAYALLDHSGCRVGYCAVGNIRSCLVSADHLQGMVSYDGTLGLPGARAAPVRQFEYPWPADAHLIMHSDGLSERWSRAGHGALFQHHEAVIAAELYRDHGRGRDDATILVVGRRA